MPIDLNITPRNGLGSHGRIDHTYRHQRFRLGTE
jgi:hypothetical protein